MVADRYRLERKVGGGRVAAVWRVQDEVTEGRCAVKLLHRSMHKHPEALTRFALEERLARELTGPYFPERVGSGVWDGIRYIAWRWHQGESLRSLFERNPKQDAPTVHSIVQETCQALAVVHAAGYAHGDLKPENLFFADRGENDASRQLKLIGFGVASRLSRPAFERVSGRRKPGEIVGTPLYLSPELILGRVPKAGQGDLWALAVIVYEALTGRAPFLGEGIAEVLSAIVEKQAPKPSSFADHLPGTFDLWWAQALEQDFATPSEFANSLARALAPVLRTSHTQRSASLPERLPPALEVLTPLSAAVAASTAISSTVAGIGPAKASGAPVPRLTSAVAVEPEPQRKEPPNSKFAPIPTPLRGFAAAGSRKTLVGITPPISLPPSAPLPVLSSAKAPSLALTSAIAMEAIEGKPIKPIDVLIPAAPASIASDLVNGVRRPANPTVPFPRPRFLPRSVPAAEAVNADESPDIAQPAPRSWQSRSPRTLRFVLTSPDHKPQRIAAVLVCAAAALVIFIAGRSPIAGTASIGQATGSLSAERSAKVDPAAPPQSGSGDDAAEGNAAGPLAPPSAPVVELAEDAPSPSESPLAGEELAPGLVLPPSSKERSSPRRTGARPPPPSLDPRPKSPATPPARQDPRAGAGGSKESLSGSRSSSPSQAPPRRATPAPRKSPGEIDFGI